MGETVTHTEGVFTENKIFAHGIIGFIGCSLSGEEEYSINLWGINNFFTCPRLPSTRHFLPVNGGDRDWADDGAKRRGRQGMVLRGLMGKIKPPEAEASGGRSRS